MKIISGKTVFASLVFLLIMSFVVNNFLKDDDFLRDKDKYKRSSENKDKIIGVEIKQQNKQGDKFLIIADTLEEIESKERKIILENSLTTIDQKGVLTKISAGNAIITNDYNDFIFSNKLLCSFSKRSSMDDSSLRITLSSISCSLFLSFSYDFFF